MRCFKIFFLSFLVGGVLSGCSTVRTFVDSYDNGTISRKKKVFIKPKNLKDAVYSRAIKNILYREGFKVADAPEKDSYRLEYSYEIQEETRTHEEFDFEDDILAPPNRYRETLYIKTFSMVLYEEKKILYTATVTSKGERASFYAVSDCMIKSALTRFPYGYRGTIEYKYDNDLQLCRRK